jgi:hypothetical protein
VTEPLPPLGLPQDLVVRYEQLREDALSSANRACGVGFTLFLRQGMVAWIQASSCAALPTPMSATPTTEISPWSGDVRAQAATILAGILLSYRSETTPCLPTCRK